MNLETDLTPDGIVCTHKTLGKVATIVRDSKAGHWFVRPYAMPCYEENGRKLGVWFKSLRAAEYFALSLAYESMETDR